MGDEHETANESENLAGAAPVSAVAPTANEAAASSVLPPRPVVQPPRPVSLPPRPATTTPALSRPSGTPPPPPVRGVSRPPPPSMRPSPPSARPSQPSMRPPPPSMRAAANLPTPSAAFAAEARPPATLPGGAPSALFSTSSLVAASTEPALAAATHAHAAPSQPALALDTLDTAALDAPATEIPPPSRATPTVPSPGADPVPEPWPMPPRTQSSVALDAGPSAHGARSEAFASANARPESARIQALLSDLMSARKELTERASELRRVVTERNALRTRLLRAESKARELSSAFRAEAQLRTEFVDTHAASSASLRARVAELEAELIALPELDLKLVELEAKLKERDEQIRGLGEQVGRADSKPPGELAGLRRIRGIGPAYERALLALGITALRQIAHWDPEEIARVAPLIKARADRILRDDWVGQARLLSDD